jgi:uncharacterized Ntn-hydrolase superfamily protein
VIGTLILTIILAAPQDFDPEYKATFSIIARDPATGELGHAEQSKALAGGTNFGAAKGGVGVITNQASTFIMYGKFGIQMLEMGFSPEEALAFLLRADEQRERRQVAMIDIQGRTAAFTGSGPGQWKGHKCGVNYCAQGNSLAGPAVLDAMVQSFESSTGPLAERLLGALDAAQAQGGDRRGKQEAYLLIVKQGASSSGFSDKVMEIRVDDDPEPLVEARNILNKIRSGQMISQGNQRLQAGDVNAALEIFAAARDKSPENDNAWVALANGYLRANRKPDALNALRRAVEINPGQKRTLPTNANFQTIKDDPEFLRIVGS